MVHNSLGVSSCSPDGRWSIRYFVRKDVASQPTNFFSPRTASHWYWPLDLFELRSELYVSLLCLKKPSRTKVAAFAFEACGVDLALLPVGSNLLQQPMTIKPLLPDKMGVSSLATMVLYKGWVYLFAVRASDRALVAARVPEAAMAHAHTAVQVMQTNGSWRATRSTRNAKVILRDAPSEMSIRYYPQWHRWLAVYKDPALLSDRVVLRAAASPLGPWSEPQEIFAIRQLDAAATGVGVFCYAAKDHPEFARAGELLVTYACNNLDPPALAGHDDLYVPKAMRVQLDDVLHVVNVQQLTASSHAAAEGGQAKAMQVEGEVTALFR